MKTYAMYILMHINKNIDKNNIQILHYLIAKMG